MVLARLYPDLNEIVRLMTVDHRWRMSGRGRGCALCRRREQFEELACGWGIDELDARIRFEIGKIPVVGSGCTEHQTT